MVGAAAAAEAIALAHRLPALRVGLHLVLVDGKPALPPERIPDLVDASGHLRKDLAAFGLAICVRRSVRAQLRAEIDAQFRVYREAGLALDHVNAHKHFHLHPAVASDVVAIGRRYGMRGLRVPREPATVLAEIESGTGPRPAYVAPWTTLLSYRVRRAGLRAPDSVFGLAWSGAMSTKRVDGLLRHLPAGSTEIYLHPATRDDFAGSAPGYRYADELAALTDPAMARLARHPEVALGGYSDL
jgi:hopanoid biosynthesis associated protein HpnK